MASNPSSPHCTNVSSRNRENEDRAAAEALTQTAGWNYDCDHPGISYCGGCVVKVDGEDMLADLREAGWDLVRR